VVSAHTGRVANKDRMCVTLRRQSSKFGANPIKVASNNYQTAKPRLHTILNRASINAPGNVLEHEIDPTVLAEWLAERDAREAMDDRTPAQRWLGDPPLWRSAVSGLLQRHLKVGPDHMPPHWR
jgi:hypothetical protein